MRCKPKDVATSQAPRLAYINVTHRCSCRAPYPGLFLGTSIRARMHCLRHMPPPFNPPWISMASQSSCPGNVLMPICRNAIHAPCLGNLHVHALQRCPRVNVAVRCRSPSQAPRPCSWSIGSVPASPRPNRAWCEHKGADSKALILIFCKAPAHVWQEAVHVHVANYTYSIIRDCMRRSRGNIGGWKLPGCGTQVASFSFSFLKKKGRRRKEKGNTELPGCATQVASFSFFLFF